MRFATVPTEYMGSRDMSLADATALESGADGAGWGVVVGARDALVDRRADILWRLLQGVGRGRQLEGVR